MMKTSHFIKSLTMCGVVLTVHRKLERKYDILRMKRNKSVSKGRWRQTKVWELPGPTEYTRKKHVKQLDFFNIIMLYKRFYTISKLPLENVLHINQSISKQILHSSIFLALKSNLKIICIYTHSQTIQQKHFELYAIYK